MARCHLFLFESVLFIFSSQSNINQIFLTQYALSYKFLVIILLAIKIKIWQLYITIIISAAHLNRWDQPLTSGSGVWKYHSTVPLIEHNWLQTIRQNTKTLNIFYRFVILNVIKHPITKKIIMRYIHVLGQNE